MSRSSAGFPADPFRFADGSAVHSGLAQSAGVVLAVRGPGLRVVQASANASALLGRPLESILLAPLEALGAGLAASLRAAAGTGGDDLPATFPCRVDGADGTSRSFNAWARRAGEDLLVVDLLPLGLFDEPPTPSHALVRVLEDAIHGLSEASTLEQLARRAAASVQAVCGHEEVRVLRFEGDAPPTVLGACRADGAPPAARWSAALHSALAWPEATARDDRLEVLVDSHAEPVRLLPQGSQPAALTLPEPVLARSALRSPPVQRLARLREAGIRAEACAVLLRDGSPWGVIACLDGQRPRALDAAQRLALELLAEAAATRITAIDNASRGELAEQVRRLQRTLVEAASRRGDWRQALQHAPELLLEPLRASGALIVHDGESLLCGQCPPIADALALGRWIDASQAEAVWHDNDPRSVDGAPAGLLPDDARVLAARLSVAQPDYLVWFRADGPAAGASAPDWSATDLSRAAAFSEMLVDLMVQVHAVRLLVTGREFDHLRRTVAGSREAVVVCDEHGRTLLVNLAFEQLAGRGSDACSGTDDLLACFQPQAAFRRLLGQVQAEQRPGRCVLALQHGERPAVPVAVRGEPVLAPGGGLMGMIFIVEDLTARRHAEAAWTRLQALLGAPAREAAAGDVEPVMSALYTNASLAAMDMADTAHTPGLAPLLQEVEAATNRATALVRRLTRVLGRG